MRVMDAISLLRQLCEHIDAHRWEDLPGLLHEDFVCRLVHTGEQFDGPTWVRFNAEYPGFDHLVLEDLVGAGDRAVSRCHVTGHATPSAKPAASPSAASEDALMHFEVATFIRARAGRIVEMTEVWTDVAQTPPEGTRPA